MKLCIDCVSECLLQAGGMLWVMNYLLFVTELKPDIALHQYASYLFIFCWGCLTVLFIAYTNTNGNIAWYGVQLAWLRRKLQGSQSGQGEQSVRQNFNCIMCCVASEIVTLHLHIFLN